MPPTTPYTAIRKAASISLAQSRSNAAARIVTSFNLGLSPEVAITTVPLSALIYTFGNHASPSVDVLSTVIGSMENRLYTMTPLVDPSLGSRLRQLE